MKFDKKLFIFVPLAFFVYIFTCPYKLLFNILMFPASLGITLLNVSPMSEAAPAFIFGIDNEIILGICHCVLTVLQGLIYYGVYRFFTRKQEINYYVIERKYFLVIGIVLAVFWGLGLLHTHFGFSNPFTMLMYPCGWFYARLEAGVEHQQFLSMVTGMDNAVMRGVVMSLLGLLQGIIVYCLYKLFKMGMAKMAKR